MSNTVGMIRSGKIKVRKAAQPILTKTLSLMRKDELIVNGSVNSSEPLLIVANHLCIDDIPTLVEAVNRPLFVLVSDEDKYTFNGLLLDINGVHWVNRLNKESRAKSAEEAISYLNGKIDFAMYPEATWNLSPNLLMLPMNYGCCNIANLAGVSILPVVSSFEDGKIRTTIGEIFKPTSDLTSSIEKLRDIMGEMTFKQIEQNYRDNICDDNVHISAGEDGVHYYERRADIDPYYWEKYVSKRYDAYGRAKKEPDKVREYESQFIFEPKTDDYAFFQTFNSSIRYDKDGNILVKRISSEKNGYEGTTCDEIDYTPFFGYGYNETNYKKILQKTK